MGSAVVNPRLESTGSVVVAHGLSCSAACGIFLDKGWKTCLLQWQEYSLPLSRQGSLQWLFYLKEKKKNQTFP